MKPVTFTLRREPDQRLDCAPLVPHRLAGLGAGEIARIPLNTTRQKVTAGPSASTTLPRGSRPAKYNSRGRSEKLPAATCPAGA